MSVKDFENNRWARDDQKVEFRHTAALAMIDSGANSGTVLDLGSGDGLLLSLLKAKGILGKGLDISEQGIAKAKAKGLDVAVHDFSAKLPFADASFDTVVMLDLLEHLYDPEFLLKEARRVAKSQVIVGVPNFSSLPARLQTLIGRVPENNRPKKGHIYWFNHPVLTSMFARNGLSMAKLESNTFFQSIPLADWLARAGTKLWPNLFSLSFVALGRKK